MASYEVCSGSRDDGTPVVVFVFEDDGGQRVVFDLTEEQSLTLKGGIDVAISHLPARPGESVH